MGAQTSKTIVKKSSSCRPGRQILSPPSMVARDWSLRPPPIKVSLLYKSSLYRTGWGLKPPRLSSTSPHSIAAGIISKTTYWKGFIVIWVQSLLVWPGGPTLKKLHSIAARDWALRLPIKRFTVLYLPLAIRTRPGWHILLIKQKVKSKTCFHSNNALLLFLKSICQSIGLPPSLLPILLFQIDWNGRDKISNVILPNLVQLVPLLASRKWGTFKNLQPHHHSQCFCIWIFHHHWQHQQ